MAFPTCRLKYSVKLRNEKTDSNELPYLGLENIESFTGRYVPTEKYEPDSECLQYKSSAILFNKLRPYLAKVHRPDKDGKCTGELLVLEPISYNRDYLFYLLLNSDFIRDVDASTYGSKMPRANWEYIGNRYLALPTLAAQKAIAAYLDKETGRIDALIAKKQRQIELLEEKRQAIITRAITNGLDPNAKMNDSGIEWIGKIPEGWQVRRLKSVAPVQGGFAFKSESFQDEGIPVVRMNNLKRGSLSIEDAACVQIEEVPTAFLLKEDDLLIGMSGSLGATGSLGNFAVVRKDDLPIALNQRVGRFMLMGDVFSGVFLRQIIQSAIFAEPISLFSNGTAQFNISSDQIGSIFIPCPPLNEQKAIGDFCESSTIAISDLKCRIGSSLDLLREYRSSLITAAVSGQIDISSVQEQPLLGGGS